MIEADDDRALRSEAAALHESLNRLEKTARSLCATVEKGAVAQADLPAVYEQADGELIVSALCLDRDLSALLVAQVLIAMVRTGYRSLELGAGPVLDQQQAQHLRDIERALKVFGVRCVVTDAVVERERPKRRAA